MSAYVRSHKKPEFAPGHKMTVAQRNAYWSMFGQVTDKMGWFELSPKELSARRYELHERAGLGPISVKAIDHLKGYDAIKGVFLAILAPHDLNAQLRQEYMSCTRLIVAIRKQFPEAYWRAIMRDRWGACDVDELTETELTQLRNTCVARLETDTNAVLRNGGAEIKVEEPVHAGAADDNEPF